MFRSRKHVSEMTFKERIAYMRQRYPVTATLRITDKTAGRIEALNEILGLPDAELLRTVLDYGLDTLERELVIQKGATVKSVCLPA
jgi:hypothetical protein